MSKYTHILSVLALYILIYFQYSIVIPLYRVSVCVCHFEQYILKLM